MQTKGKEELAQLGGVSGLAEALKSDLSSGLDTQSSEQLSVSKRRRYYGANKFTEVDQKAFWALLSDNLKDPTLLLLMAAALVSCLHNPYAVQLLCDIMALSALAIADWAQHCKLA